MSKFVNHIGLLFARYAPVTDCIGVDRIGTMTVDGDEVIEVRVNENRTVEMMTVGGFFRNTYTFDRDALNVGEVTVDSGTGAILWRVTPTEANWHGDPSTIRFFKDVTMEVSEAIKGELYDYD